MWSQSRTTGLGILEVLLWVPSRSVLLKSAGNHSTTQRSAKKQKRGFEEYPSELSGETTTCIQPLSLCI
eukprot:jgi/Botrbrau1/22746/Bobra.0132s0079.1